MIVTPELMSSLDDQLRDLRQNELAEKQKKLAEKQKKLAEKQKKEDDEKREQQEKLRRWEKHEDEIYLPLESFIAENINNVFESIKSIYCNNNAVLELKRSKISFRYYVKERKEVKILFWKTVEFEFKEKKGDMPAIKIQFDWGEWKREYSYGGKRIGITVTSTKLFVGSGRSYCQEFENSNIKYSSRPSEQILFSGICILREDSTWQQKLEQTLFSLISSKKCSWSIKTPRFSSSGPEWDADLEDFDSY